MQRGKGERAELEQQETRQSAVGVFFPKGAGRQPGTDVEDRKKESGHTMRVNKRRGDVGKNTSRALYAGTP